jgi:hypothetical protein
MARLAGQRGRPACSGQLLVHEKQAAEELGQWTEKREYSSRVGIDVVKAQLRVTQHRLAEEKREALAKGLPWPPK